jgi:hypothetical protein
MRSYRDLKESLLNVMLHTVLSRWSTLVRHPPPRAIAVRRTYLRPMHVKKRKNVCGNGYVDTGASTWLGPAEILRQSDRDNHRTRKYR